MKARAADPPHLCNLFAQIRKLCRYFMRGAAISAPTHANCAWQASPRGAAPAPEWSSKSVSSEWDHAPKLICGRSSLAESSTTPRHWIRRERPKGLRLQGQGPTPKGIAVLRRRRRSFPQPANGRAPRAPPTNSPFSSHRTPSSLRRKKRKRGNAPIPIAPAQMDRRDIEHKENIWSAECASPASTSRPSLRRAGENTLRATRSAPFSV